MSHKDGIRVELVNEPQHADAVETFERIRAKSGIGNIHRTLANSPTVFKNFIGLSHALRYETDIDPVERELAICCVLERHDGQYELEPHRRFAKVLGATDEQIAHVSAPEQATCFSERERAILQFARHIAADPAERSSYDYRQIEAHLDNRQRIELGLTLSVYMGLAHFTALFAVPEEDFSSKDAPSMENAARK